MPLDGNTALPPVNLKLSLLGRFKLTEILNRTVGRFGLISISFLLHEKIIKVCNKMIFLNKILPKTFNSLYLIDIPELLGIFLF